MPRHTTTRPDVPIGEQMSENQCNHVYSAASRLCVVCGSPVPSPAETSAHVHLWDFDTRSCTLCGRKDTDAEPVEGLSEDEEKLADVIPLHNPSIPPFEYTQTNPKARAKARAMIRVALVEPLMEVVGSLEAQIEGQLMGLSILAVRNNIALDELIHGLRIEYAESLRQER